VKGERGKERKLSPSPPVLFCPKQKRNRTGVDCNIVRTTKKERDFVNSVGKYRAFQGASMD